VNILISSDKTSTPVPESSKKKELSPLMRNQPSPKDKRSLPSNFGVCDGVRVPHCDCETGETPDVVAPIELKMLDQFGNVVFDAAGVAAAGLSIANGPGWDATPLKFEASQ
jgi:hypothetical protein